MIIGIVVGVGIPFLALLSFLIYFFFFRRTNKSFINSEGELVTKGTDDEMIDGAIFDDTVISGSEFPYGARNDDDIGVGDETMVGGHSAPYRSGTLNNAVNF